jgi:hypothetical protein
MGSIPYLPCGSPVLHNQYLPQCWWWRRVGVVVVVVLISDMVVSVGDVMIVKRFEIEIQDSQLYASRYNDDCDFI